MNQPWYLYPLDSPGGGYGEIQDPMGNYLKPDTNVAVPSGTPITALFSGVVTDVHMLFGQPSVTVALDNPINPLATHTSYNFLGSSNVTVGERITAGQQIGVAGGAVNTAFALTPDPVWGSTNFNLNATGNPLLDPRPVLESIRSGLGQGAYQTFNLSAGKTSSTACAPWDIPCMVSELVSGDFFQRGAIIFIGIVLALIGIIVLTVGHGAQIVQENPEILAAA